MAALGCDGVCGAATVGKQSEVYDTHTDIWNVPEAMEARVAHRATSLS